jgi:phosphoribosylformylglycinamidine synthase
MALGEVLTNLLAAPVADFKQTKLCANWMAACGEPGQDAALYQAVEALAMEACPSLGLSIPVGKDSLSMRTQWQDANGARQSVISPVSLNLTAVAPVSDVRQIWTPMLQTQTDSVLILIDLGQGRARLGGSILAQTQGVFGEDTPDLEDLQQLERLRQVLLQAREQSLVQAYHDRSDGGLIACLAEMAFASRCGLTINVDLLTIDPGELEAFAAVLAGLRQSVGLCSICCLLNATRSVMAQFRGGVACSGRFGRAVFDCGLGPALGSA